MEDVIAAVETASPLPDRPLLLTFDDGYSDHYTYVLPILVEFKVRGAFYATTAAVRGGRVLDANKIHFILASVRSPTDLIEAIEAAVAAGQDASLPSVEHCRERFWTSNRFDSAPVLYCKQLLQHGLPEEFRRQLLDRLFHRFVTVDEASFAAELYLGVAQLQEMIASGMHIGGHGGTHCWLGRLTLEEQRQDIQESFDLISALGGASHRDFTFCYPYGSYDPNTLQLLRELNCRAALTVRAELARLEPDQMLELPRLDTTDLPNEASAAPGYWTLRAANPSS
jgi:peptidoglycan/xylan/chitin deacetylase (PgdA/CDA1 family)